MAEIINNEVLEEATPETQNVPKREIVFEEALEAILFAAGHPISYATLARVFDYTPGAIKNKVLRYAEKYNDLIAATVNVDSPVMASSGITLIDTPKGTTYQKN